MKISKKLILFGLGIAVFSLFLFSQRQRVSAACIPGEVCGTNVAPTTLTKPQLDSATYTAAPPDTILVVINGITYTFKDKEIFTAPLNFKAQDGPFCDGTLFGSNSFADKLKGITVPSTFDEVVKSGGKGTANLDYLDPSGKCQNYKNASINIAVPASTSSSTAPDNSCEANYTGAAKEFNWLFCSALRGVDAMFGFIFDTVQDQLRICTGTSSTTGEKCSNNLLSPQVEKSWAVFRDLATALLVIAMLIMVFSQALSFGPFDAYTVRKMLPRLAAAAILIQISWPLFKYAVDLSNDLGQGIQNLMLAPFGGTGKMGFDNLIASAGNWGPGVVVTSATAFTAAVIAFSGLTILGWGLIAVSAIISVLVGLLVLLFRQMLIIMCMILAPIALVAFVLPGTQRYWKLWQDNFLKLLLMFPLIMAMIAAGKIFAYVGGNSATGFMGVIIVLIGFVGPLWFLPKTFRWGGQIFAAAATGAWNGTKQFRNAPGKYALDKAKINREERANERAERLANNRGRFFDPLLAGRTNFALARRARRDKYQSTLEAGRKTADEQAQRQVIAGAYENLNHEDKVRADILVAQGRVDDRYGTGLDGREASQQRAALERLKKYGDWDAISLIREAGYLGEQGERVWQNFVAANIGDIHANVPHLSPQRTDSARIAYAEYRGAKDFELDEVLRQALEYTVRDANSGRLVHVPAADMAAKRTAHIAQAQRALSDTQFMATQSEHAQQVWRQIAALPQLTADVQVIPPSRPGQPPAVIAPDSALLNNPERQAQAVESIRTNLTTDAENAPGSARIFQQSTARLLANPELDGRDRAVYEDVMRQVKLQAGGDPASAAGQSYNSVIDQINAQLATLPAQAEQRATTLGQTAAEITAARQAAEAYVAAEQARLRNTGLDRL